MKDVKRNISRFMILAAGCAFLGSCNYSPRSIDIKPKQEPVYNFTQSSSVLSCLGEHINRSQSVPVDVYISDIPDHTIPTIESGFLTKNAVMMVTTAIDRLRSNKVEVVGRGGGRKGRRQVQVLGAFTELNRTTRSNAISGEAILPGGIQVEVGADDNFNHIALDLAMSEFNRIIPGTATSVSIQVRGNSGDATLTYDEGEDFAAIGALGFSAQEGFHSAERLLIETSVALMMSKYFDVDIKNCLQSTIRRDKREMGEPSDFDQPIFPRTDIPVEPPVAPEASPSPPAAPVTPPAPLPPPVQEQQSSPMPITPLTAPQNSHLDTDKIHTELPEENGVVILPKGAKNRYLQAQPQEYMSQQNSGFSGVPPGQAIDPAQGNNEDYMEEVPDADSLEWGRYKPPSR